MIDSLREAARNRLLRHADWRFLLPDPNPGTAVCFAEGLLASAVTAIAGRVMTPDETPDNVDLSVAAEPDARTLATAVAALRPGGACYIEWRSPRRGVAAITRRMEAAGLQRVCCYWPWPPPRIASPKFWIPLASPEPLRYLRSADSPLMPPILRLDGRALLVAFALADRLGIRYPICAVGEKPAGRPAEARATIEGAPRWLAKALVGAWAAFDSGSLPDRIDWMLQTLGPRSVSKVVALAFEKSAASPRIVVKTARTPEALDGLRRECATLRSRGDTEFIEGIPRVLFVREADSAFAVGESAMRGVPLWRRLRPTSSAALALAATDWSARFAASSTRPQPVVRAEWWDRLVRDPLDAFAARYRDAIDPHLLARCRRHLEGLPDLPLVCEQRDYGPWNILVDDAGALSVLDWESSEMRGLPALDLIYFLAYHEFFLSGALKSGRLAAAYRSTLDPSSPAGQLRQDCLTRYADRVGIDARHFPALSMLTWIVHARGEHDRLRADVGGDAPQTIGGSVFLQLWRETADAAKT
ncbi:MAG: phosphotransferase family protein [Longimicrobiales bacterium]